MFFKRKNEFKPDRTEGSLLKKLYLTPTQRKKILKWALIALVLVVLSLLQDVVFSRLRIGGAVVSDKHANFILNDNGATAQDVKTLIADVKSAVKTRFGVELQEEIRYLE